MTEHGSDSWSALLRLHRHDLLNGLQLVTGYLQLNKPERALRSVDRMAAWLRSISWIHAVTEDTAYDGWFKVSHTAPHVLLQERPSDLTYTRTIDESLSSAWQWLEEICALHGIMEMGLVVVGKTMLGQPGANVIVENDEEVPEWWDSRPQLERIEWTWNR